jgi:hypothetical protein
VDGVDLVDVVDYSVGMNAGISVCVAEPAKAPAEQKAAAKLTPRLRGTMEVIFGTMRGFRSSPRQEMLAAAKKAGYTPAEVNAALDLLMTTTISLVDPTPAPATAAKGPREDDKPKVFDPQAAGQRLVETLQTAEGGAWTGQELLALFNLMPSTLHRRRKEHRVIYWRDARHEFHYPKWQFTPTGALLPGIQQVLEQFKSQDEWRVMSYFLGKRAQLDGLRPLDLLRQGDVEKALGHAKIHAEENTW